ncbi:ArdC-like ssDNA-binding domain-containing protein [Enterococcus faecium]|uniref:ArdC-like ssDNA-binding domain-containing protein n=1 Tax=Enterococcus faecium TaxID=1352 RepID=UPI002DBFC028|nr:hypothetical protein [Enterococcus faecium]MEB5584484.1 ArdC-like ssDNA-binding domain-containing protein [Enterococcus faecium]
MENKFHYTTQRMLALVFFFLIVIFTRGTTIDALETVDPGAIKENNNLALYHDSDSLRNIEVTGIDGFKILDEYSTKKQKVLAWPKVNDLKGTSKIIVHYQKVGTYLGKEIDCDLTFSNFVAHAGVNQEGLAKTINGKKYYNYLLFDKNIYRGFFMQSINSLSQQALDAVKKHTHSPEDVKELLNFMSRFPERSFRNQLLIEEQFPGATACLGRAALKKEGIYIKKGEQGNKIFVRKTVKGFYEKGRGFVRETEATPEDKKRIESGQIEVIKKPYYTIEKVFDITQTQLKPEDYPKIFPNRVFDFQLDQTGHTELQVGIQAVAKNIGIQIRDMTESEVYQRELGQARGAYVRNEFTGEEEIVMNTRNTPTQHLATSIHELAHARMHKFSELDTATKELQAEMTSYIVCKHFGMDTSEKAIPYIATWTKNGQTLDDKEAAERGKIMNDVSRVANEFIQTISNEINQYREREPEIQPAEVKQDEKNVVETAEQKNIVLVGSLWIDKKDGKVLEEDTGRTLHLKDAAFIEDTQHNQVILKGKSYGKEIQTALPSEEFALGNPFRFSLETVSEVAKRKNEIYYEQQLSQKERV